MLAPVYIVVASASLAVGLAYTALFEIRRTLFDGILDIWLEDEAEAGDRGEGEGILLREVMLECRC